MPFWGWQIWTRNWQKRFRLWIWLKMGISSPPSTGDADGRNFLGSITISLGFFRAWWRWLGPGWLRSGQRSCWHDYTIRNSTITLLGGKIPFILGIKSSWSFLFPIEQQWFVNSSSKALSPPSAFPNKSCCYLVIHFSWRTPRILPTRHCLKFCDFLPELWCKYLFSYQL